MLSLVEVIGGIIKKINSNYKFIFETDRLMNVRADDAASPIAFWEEYTNGQVVFDNYGGMYERVQVELSFMRLAPRDNFQCNALDREQIRQQIKDEVVYDFLRAIYNKSNDGFFAEPLEEVEVLAEPPRFDSAWVSVLCRFTIERAIC